MGSRSLVKRRRFRVLAGTCLALIGTFAAVGSSASTTSPPKPNLSHCVPSAAQITSERSVQLTHSGPAQVVVTYEGAQPNSQGSTSRDLIILSWDHFAKRWVTVFDGAKVAVGWVVRRW